MMRPAHPKFLRVIQSAILGTFLPFVLYRNGWAQVSPQPLIPSNFESYFYQLTDTNTDNDETARKALVGMGTAIVDPLILKLESPDVQARRVAASLVGAFGPDSKKATPSLIRRLQEDTDGEVRAAAVYSLEQIGPAASTALPVTIRALKKDKDQDVRVFAARAVSRIAPTAPQTLQALSESLRQDEDLNVQKMSAAMLVEGAERSSEQFQQVLSDLRSTLSDEKWQVQLAGAIALAANGREIKESSLTLNALLLNQDVQVREQAMEALTYIAIQLRNKAEQLSLSARRDAEEGLNSSIATLKRLRQRLIASGTDSKQEVEEIDRLIARLDGTVQFIKPSKLFLRQLGELIVKNWILSGFVIYLLILLSLWSVLLQFRPLWLWKISELLFHVEKIPLPLSQWGPFSKPIHNSTLIVFFHYHPRVLDAWVDEHLSSVRKDFAQKQTVKERAVHIPIPVVLDGKDIAQFTNQNLRETFKRKLVRLLIWGEGGSGKTSLACEIARWGMSDTSELRLCNHRMLPILLEQELDFEVAADRQVLREAIRGQLRDLLNAPEPISEEFLEQLLKQQRLLVIVDHFSEMSDATRKKIRLEDPDFPINALIVTSRIEEKLGGLNRTTLKPMRIAGNYLSEFMGSYLTCRGKRELFTDEEFFEACSRLAAIASNREITVLLAKLYAEQMIAVKVGGTTDDIPTNIPELMLQYLNQVNQTVTEKPLSHRAVHHDARIIAWECVKQTYQPTMAERDAVLAALDYPDAEAHLDYLENRLRIIQTIGVAQEHVRFALDPLAEYLAGLYLIQFYGDNHQAWRDCLARVDEQQKKASIQGFLLALRDCCLSNPEKIKLPDFLVSELQQRIKQN